MKPTRYHALRRTSPKGGPFIGTCTLCGKTDLLLKDMQLECLNIRGLDQNAALLELIE